MNVRAQVSMVFHLDKCLGCHTCSVVCKNIWTDRRGTEYMWWNNVETKPGTGYPTLWEDQVKYKGGWERRNGRISLRSTGKLQSLTNIFHHPHLPTMDDYYEPWTYRYQDLFDATSGNDQPTARPISMVTGQHMDVEAGPNWDDDLGGSPIYAANDPGLGRLSEAERAQLLQIERLVFFYLPRICNHCLNPACIAACPSGALYKRGEDGIVLVNQDQCRGWRFCVAACPYKKVYYNWATGKSEKCILCFPRLETDQAPSCFHACVGRIRYLGLLFYDADAIEAAAKVEDGQLVEAQRNLILNPFDSEVIRGARRNGVSESWIRAAQCSPVYKFVKLWELALPLHPEFRTIPMLFYVPPLLPAMGALGERGYGVAAQDFFGAVQEARVPLRYLAALFAGGNERLVELALAKLLAVRAYRRSITTGDLDKARAVALLEKASCSQEEAEEIFRLTALAPLSERHAVPPYQRELPIEEIGPVLERRGDAGVGLSPRRGEF